MSVSLDKSHGCQLAIMHHCKSLISYRIHNVETKLNQNHRGKVKTLFIEHANILTLRETTRAEGFLTDRPAET